MKDVSHHGPDGPPIPGLAFRALRGPEDYPAMAEVVTLSEAADQIEETATAEQLAHECTHTPGLDPRTDVLLAQAGDVLVGYSYVWHSTTQAGEALFRHSGYVRPEWRRRGLGRALWHWNEGRLRQIARDLARETTGREEPARPGYFQVMVEDTALGKEALARQEGYRPARYFYFMQRPDLEDVPQAPLPPGLELRPARPEHLRAVWAAKEEAFSEHWGYTLKTEADFEAWARDPRLDLSLWAVAWESRSGQVAGVALNAFSADDNARYGFRRGWVHSLGVRRPWRGRGLGRALLAESLRRLRQAGMSEAVLGVDTGNETGALRLYESLGFHVLNKDAVYRKPLDASGSA